MSMTELLTPPKTIAVVGLSDKPDRASYQVAEYLLHHDFTIIPVNPMISEVFNLKVYPSISDIPVDMHIDIVDIFRKSEEVPNLIREVLLAHRNPAIWMQEGVVSIEAKTLAEANGLEVVMDLCIMKMHRQNQPY